MILYKQFRIINRMSYQKMTATLTDQKVLKQTNETKKNNNNKYCYLPKY